MKEISEAQKAVFELMKFSSFNNFNPNQVINDLIENRSLWRSCMMDRADLIKIRDLHKNRFNADTLYIFTTGVNDDRIEYIARSWNPDEVGYLSDDDTRHAIGMSHPDVRVLFVWWD